MNDFSKSGQTPKTKTLKTKTKRLKKCHYCKERSVPYGDMRVFCFKNECIEEHNRKTRRVTKHNAKKALRNDNRTTLLQDCQIIANRIGKLKCWIKGELECVTCGRVPNKTDGGHCFSVGDYSAIRFYTPQINPQCVNCNRYNGGREKEYEVYLTANLGKSKVEWLKSQKNVTVDHSKAYLRRFKEVMGKRLKKLETRYKEIVWQEKK